MIFIDDFPIKTSIYKGFSMDFNGIPSGKCLHNCGKPWKITMLLMSKSNISTGQFSIAMLNYQKVNIEVSKV